MISFVYFDLGGVMDIDLSEEEKWTRMQREMGVTEEKQPLFDKLWDEYEPKYCVGEDMENFVPVLEKELGLKFPPGYSLLKDFVDRFFANESIWPVVDEIHKQVPIGLLTNMYPGMRKAIEEKGILPDIEWDALVDSSEVGLKKPNEDIYRLSEEKAGFSGTEILFVDNIEKNLVGARKLNWHTFLYDTANPEAASRELLNTFHKLHR